VSKGNRRHVPEAMRKLGIAQYSLLTRARGAAGFG